MAIAFVAKKGKPFASYSGGFKVARPAGSVSGDALVEILNVVGSEAATALGTSTLTKEADKYSATDALRAAGFVGVDNGSTEPEVKWTGSLEGEGVLLAFSGTAASPFDAVGTPTAIAASKTPEIPGVTTAEANEMLIAVFVESEAREHTEAPSGLTTRLNGTGSEEELFGIHIATGIQASAGASGAKHFTFGTAIAGVGFLIALKPEAEEAKSSAHNLTLLGVGA